jgi:GTP-binding protein EngB required for normal cell division
MSIAACLERLEEAIDAAAALGLDVTEAGAIRETARQRLGFPADAYVLALAGGTGVGKSSLLNAIAGQEVSRASARRPTTGHPVAWVPAASRVELTPLLDWLGVREVREHPGSGPGPVAVLDLPDLDSIAPEHRAQVDELLPRLDAVAWVADPEKYQDALLHDEYLRRWGNQLDRQIVILNKADRIAPADGERLRKDLVARLRADGLPNVPVVLASSVNGSPGTDEVRRWLESGIEAKRIVTGRLAAEARAAVRDLADRAGVDPASPEPLLTVERRNRVLRDITTGVLEVLDLDGLERQAVAATRLAARPRGGGPMGPVTTFIYRWSGREQVAADPAGYLRRWRQRGSLARATEPVRQVISEVLPKVPPAARSALAAAGEPGPLQARLGEAIDRAVAAQAGTFKAPRSALWWLIGLGQYVVTALLIFAALWFVALWVAGGTAVGTVQVPLLGPVPQPVIFLGAVLLVGFLLARALGLHAGWLGRRWARRLRATVNREIEDRMSGVLGPLEGLEAARQRLARAARRAAETCHAEAGVRVPPAPSAAGSRASEKAPAVPPGGPG